MLAGKDWKDFQSCFDQTLKFDRFINILLHQTRLKFLDWIYTSNPIRNISNVWSGDDLDTLGWQFGRIEKMSKISFFVVTPAQTVVDSTKSVSAELSDFGLWRQLQVESEIKSPWALKTIINDIKNILYST
jgi:hypothetical protein